MCLVNDLHDHRMIGYHQGHGLDIIVGLNGISSHRDVVYFDGLVRLREVNDKICRLLYLFNPKNQFKSSIGFLEQQIKHNTKSTQKKKEQKAQQGGDIVVCENCR